MTQKVKVLFVFLAVLAVVSVFSFLDVFRGVRSAKLNDPPKPLPLDISIDADQDGLSDADESYWDTDFQDSDTDGDGFLDGEEVASGYDPREASSHELGDDLEDTIYGAPEEITADFNITESLAQGMISGIYADDLRPGVDDAKFKEGVNALSFSAVDNFYRTQTAPTITTNIVDNSKESQITYIEAVAQIVKKDLLDLPQKANLNDSIISQLSFFKTKSSQFQISHGKIAALSVPEDWLDIHKTILDFIYRSYLNYLYISSYETDMVKATIAMAELSNLNNELSILLQAIQAKIKTKGLPIDNSLYQIMNLLDNG